MPPRLATAMRNFYAKVTAITGSGRPLSEADRSIMGLLGRQRGFDRGRILAAAARARLKKRRRKAIALYRWVLAVEARNPDLHEKLAPLLAETGQEFDAWISFRATGRSSSTSLA